MIRLAIILSLLTGTAFAQGADDLVDAAQARTAVTVAYTPDYVSLDYPGGDVPEGTGVCTDVVVRSYRAGLDLDLQHAVHEDMTADFAAYPADWGLSRPDPNIDHRRVPNLEAFLARRGAERDLPDALAGYEPGDLVTFRIGGRLPHIGIVTDRLGDGGVPLVVHNAGWGTVEEDVLRMWPVTARFRYLPEPVR